MRRSVAAISRSGILGSVAAVRLFALIIGGLVAMVAALSLDLQWLAIVIFPFWIAGLVWAEREEWRTISRAGYQRRRR